MRHALARSPDRVVAGVCGGLADGLGWDATHVRIGYVVASVLSAAFPGMLVYAALWFLMPGRDSPASPELRRGDDRVFGGVCGGLADWLGWSRSRVRLAFLVGTVLSGVGPGLLAYLALWFLMPESLIEESRPA